jgi:hypothetical protein
MGKDYFSQSCADEPRIPQWGNDIRAMFFIWLTTITIISPNRLMLKTSDYFILTAALASMILSIYLWFNGQTDAGLFVGIWVPSILGFGAYFKIIQYGGRS